MPLTRKLQQIVEDLAVVDDPQERLALLVDRARHLPAMPASERTPERRVVGCVSTVWLAGEFREGHCHFRCDAESLVVRGLVAFLCEFFSGFTPEAILASDPDPLQALGIARNLSPTRRNGLNAARAAIRRFAASQTHARPGDAPASAPDVQRVQRPR